MNILESQLYEIKLQQSVIENVSVTKNQHIQ